MKLLAAAIAFLALAIIAAAWIHHQPRHDYSTRSDKFGNIVRTDSATGKTEVFHRGHWLDLDKVEVNSRFTPPPLNSLQPESP